ncbi:MAG: endolytic transglycosylase MltG, partial [Oscillospiraceae bacterium]|nr:endolytic transglycosylase MltG [Oscillospiraceae bacterium]
ALVNGMISTSGDRASATVTIPEGYECADIFALLEESGVCTVSQLEQAAASYPFEYDFLADRPYGDSNRLEGYLFPDTYQFFLGDKPENVIDKFLRNFDRKLTDELLSQIDVVNQMISDKMQANGFELAQIRNSQLTLHDIITIASLVEKETAKTSESASIASVIYNRLCSKLYPCLQIDATIQYALTERKEQLSNADKAVISPYNTYTNAGLPAGPIANPGLNSIRAALYPAETEYYFYALGREGVHKFSVTYYEHQEFLTETEQPNDTP